MEDPDIDGRIILKWVFERLDDLAHDRDRWQALVNAVRNLQIR